MRFEVISKNFQNEEKLIGLAFTTIGQILGQKAQIWSKPLGLPGRRDLQGHIFVKAEAAKKSDNYVAFSCHWLNVKNWSDGFIGIGAQRKKVKFQICRQISENHFLKLAETEFIK